MKKFFWRLERYLLRMVVLGIVMVVVVQGLMTHEPFRFFLSWGERMEGQPIPVPTAQPQAPAENAAQQELLTVSPQAQLVVALDQYSSLPKAAVLVNGQQVGNFNDKEYLLQVQAGDVIEIDASYYNFPISFTIASTSANLVFPQALQVYKTNQSVVMIGKTVVK